MSYLFRFAKFCLINIKKYRSLGISDFIASLISVGLLALLNIGLLLWKFGDELLTHDSKAIGIVIAATIIIVAIALPATAYLINLRTFGITHADSQISAGIDYKESIERLGNGGLKFMGVSGTKLIAHDSSIRGAIEAAARANSKIQMLIVDPNSEDALKDLEGRDRAVGYMERIDGSSKFLKRMAEENSHTVEVRQYYAKSASDLKPFRLLFSASDCLLSPFVKGTGVGDQGRKLPQICISSQGWPKSNSPTFFAALNSYFDKNWEDAEIKKPIGDEIK